MYLICKFIDILDYLLDFTVLDHGKINNFKDENKHKWHSVLNNYRFYG